MRLGEARALQGVLAFLSGWGVLAVPFLLAAEGEARSGWNSSAEFVVILGALTTLASAGSSSTTASTPCTCITGSG